MLNKSQRMTILELHNQGMKIRQIAKALGFSRPAVRRVIRSNTSEVPFIQRSERAQPHRQRILELYASCNGNLVRVHEELIAEGAELSYQALTAFCRRHDIGQTEKKPAGQYYFVPGEEIQHDTSPHRVMMGGKPRNVQTASAVLCYSRMLFFQFFPRFQRFDCKVFLTDAHRYFGGAAQRVMIDNTHVVVLRGTGSRMIPVPEMAAFADRLGFRFVAHEVGNANHSGRVERPFHFIERNFLAGRTFADWDDLNRQARAWCDKVNGTYKKHIRAIPRELYAVERPQLKPLPAWVPEVYRLHQRIVEYEGQRVTLAEHRPPRGQGIKKPDVHPEEAAILETTPEIADYVAALKKHSRKLTVFALRQLLRMMRDYPRDALVAAVEDASRYGLYDLDRVERMVLRRIARDYFLLDDWKGNT